MFTVAEAAAKFGVLREQLNRVVIGQDCAKEQLLACVLAGGHALLEGPPGTGKTLLVLTLSRLLGCAFNRVQFTPDLMPSDLIGTNVFNAASQEFEFHAGPIFTDLLLADEINRTPPKIHSALLEAMQESAVSVDGFRHNLSPIFTVLATQHPAETEGVYSLPEPQRDRFMLLIAMDCPTASDEISILVNYADGNRLHDAALNDLGVTLSADDLMACRRTASKLVRVEKKFLTYIQRVVSATRHAASLAISAGPRASIALLEASRALALLRGRDTVTHSDIQDLALPVLRHRVVLSQSSIADRSTLNDVLKRLIEDAEI